MTRTVRTILLIAGVACFAIGAAAAATWIPDANPSAFALAGFGFWAASDLP